jgi:hypothetical protein
MLSHEPKNYALLGYDGSLVLRGVAFRSSRAEPFGEAFLRRAIACLLQDDIGGVRDAYLETLEAIRQKRLSAYDVSSKVRLVKSPERYLETRHARREASYEAMLASGRTIWAVGDRIRIYRDQLGSVRIVGESERLADYDANHYARLLREGFAIRLARAFSTDDYATIFGDPDQMSLFSPSIDVIRSILTCFDR